MSSVLSRRLGTQRSAAPPLRQPPPLRFLRNPSNPTLQLPAFNSLERRFLRIFCTFDLDEPNEVGRVHGRACRHIVIVFLSVARLDSYRDATNVPERQNVGRVNRGKKEGVGGHAGNIDLRRSIQVHCLLIFC